MTIENDTPPNWDLLRQRLKALESHPKSSLSVDKHATRLLPWRFTIVAFLAIFLIWEIITRSLVAYLADVAPGVAIRLRSTNPTALLQLAQDKLNLDPVLVRDPVDASTRPPLNAQPPEPGSADKDLKGKRATPSQANSSPRADPQTIAQIRAWVNLALLNDPLSARAFSILGRLSQYSSDDGATKRFMKAAVDRSLLETPAVYWMMQRAIQENDFHLAVRYGDTLLRHDLGAIVPLMPILAKLAENPHASHDLEQLLATDPPWKSQFFERLPENVSDARTPLVVLLNLKGRGVLPTAKELVGYLNFLTNRQLYELAYYTWLQFLPLEELNNVRHLFNGSFEFASTGLPFNWVFANGSGATIQIGERPGVGSSDNLDPGDKHALFIQFADQRIDEFRVEQILMLPPGSYHFRGKHRLNLIRQQGLLWRINCVSGSNALIGESPALKGTDTNWMDFEFSFSVPENDCPAQSLKLDLSARSESERFAAGSAWFDDLDITFSAEQGSLDPETNRSR